MSKNVKDDVCFRVFFGIHLPTLWIWKGQVVEMSKHWGFHGGISNAGWFISWNILLKWMMWGYPHGWETSWYQNTVERTPGCIQATVLLLLKICATCLGRCSFPTYHCPFTVQIYVKSKYGPHLSNFAEPLRPTSWPASLTRRCCSGCVPANQVPQQWATAALQMVSAVRPDSTRGNPQRSCPSWSSHSYLGAYAKMM